MPTLAEQLNIDPEDISRRLRGLAERNRPLAITLQELEEVALTQLGRDESEVRQEEMDELRGLYEELLPRWRQAAGEGLRPFGFPEELSEHYDDVEFIGEGGFARVYRAHSLERGQLVALKVLKELESRSARRMFLRELEVWRGLRHRNIVEFYQEDIQPPYIEVEYVDGKTLEELEKPVDVEYAADLGLKVSEGLLHAHKQQRLHGDIKPSNVLLTAAGEPKLSDWGLGRVMMDTPLRYSGSMSRQFTPYYAAPEHFDRQEPLDFKTDVYQLGVLVFELADLGEEVEMYQGQSVSLSEVVERFQDIEHRVRTL